MSSYEKIFTLPSGDFFEAFMHKVVKGNIFSGQDETLFLVTQLEKLAPEIFKLFELESIGIRRTQNIKEDKAGSGWLAFPVTKTTTTYHQGQASYTIFLERMYNGHLGCDEDDLKVSFQYQDKAFSLNCYIFVSPEFTFKAEQLTQAEIDVLEQLWQTELGLK